MSADKLRIEGGILLNKMKYSFYKKNIEEDECRQPYGQQHRMTVYVAQPIDVYAYDPTVCQPFGSASLLDGSIEQPEKLDHRSRTERTEMGVDPLSMLAVLQFGRCFVYLLPRAAVSSLCLFERTINSVVESKARVRIPRTLLFIHSTVLSVSTYRLFLLFQIRSFHSWRFIRHSYTVQLHH